MCHDRELGLETLLRVRDELHVNLDDAFLEACFEIQKRHQFNHDRTLSTRAMERLIESSVDKGGGKQTEDGSLTA